MVFRFQCCTLDVTGSVTQVVLGTAMCSLKHISMSCLIVIQEKHFSPLV